MTDLQAAMKASIDKLRSIEDRIHRRTDSVIPFKCYKEWEKLASLHRVLSGAAELLATRESSREQLQSLCGNFVKKPDQTLSFPQARHLCLTSYMTTTWSIYDRLANVCGRLQATDVFGDRNPRLCWDLLPQNQTKQTDAKETNSRKQDNKSVLAFAGRRAVEEAYGWPVRVSYTIRNWLVHEGYSLDDSFGTTHLFGSSSVEEEFILSDEAKNKLQKRAWYATDDNGYPKHCCLGDGDPWIEARVDVRLTVEKYHSEIDQMFAGLVRWSVDSFVSQFDAFTVRFRTVGE